MKKTCMITAHSGADQTPENSLAFVSYALTLPVDALEVDVRCQNETLLLGHDAAGDVLLSSALELVKNSSLSVNLDLKEAGLCSRVHQLIQTYGLEGRTIFSGSVRLDELSPEIMRDVRIFLNIEEYIPDLYDRLKETPDFITEAAETISRICMEHQISVVNANYRLVNETFLNILAKHGIGVSAWTINESRDIEAFLQKGLYNLTTRRARNALQIRFALV